jgi:hypothetical protein
VKDIGVNSLSTVTDIKADALEIIRTRPGTSWVELIRELGERGHETEGDWAMEAAVDNLVLWAGMSEGVLDALGALKAARKAHLHPLESNLELMAVYIVDGVYLRMPIAKRVPKSGYKEPHWAPCVWYIGSSLDCASCKKRGWAN